MIITARGESHQQYFYNGGKCLSQEKQAFAVLILQGKKKEYNYYTSVVLSFVCLAEGFKV